MSRHYALALLVLFAGGLAMAGCAGKSATQPAPPHTAAAAPAGTRTTPRPAAGVTAKPKTATPANPLPESTGIPACDDYLASYVACHRAAAIYAPDQIEGHYEAMRESLLRDSQDPDIRPQLGARCTSLAVTLRQALHGKSCASSASPATGSSH